MKFNIKIENLQQLLIKQHAKVMQTLTQKQDKENMIKNLCRNLFIVQILNITFVISMEACTHIYRSYYSFTHLTYSNYVYD